MYIEKKKIGKDYYNYLKISVRLRDKVRTKTIAYLGKGNIHKNKAKRIFERFKKNADEVKQKTLEELKLESVDINKEILSEQQLNKLKQIENSFNKKLKILDKETLKDMYNDFITLFVFNTNAIEGNTLTLRDTDLLLNKNITPSGKSLREINDHLNSKDTFNFMLEKKPKINHETIIKIHSLLMKNIDKRIGYYRIHNVRVFGATFEASPAEFVRIDMNILLKWFRKEKNRLHPLILASAFHHKFENIHPFYDGNGRTGRMLLNLILINNKMPPLIVPDAQRKRYYNALSEADNTELNKTQLEHKKMVDFCYFSLLKTYNTIFARWG
ncbi:Fic family protein [Candidatus Woesearchaeota archaeon]|nr:Fic family protein [Candidatus Woesearchaeota archaeon]